MARSKNRMAAALQPSKLRIVDDATLDLQSPASARFDSWDQPGGGWQNPVTGFGTSRDKTTYNRFAPTSLMNVEELSAIYHGEDLAARIIDIVPDEMLREGFSVDVGDPGLNALLSEKLEALGIDDKLADGIRWGRLFGGGALLLGADDGRSASTPLAIERVQALSYLYVFDRRYLQPLTWYRDPGNPKLGQPETYMVLAASSYTDMPMAIVHETRLVLFGGASTGIRERQQNMGWDVSVLQRPAKVLGDFNIGWNAASVLLQDGNQAVFTMSGLAETLAAGGEAALLKRLKQVDFGRSVINATIVDAGTGADGGGDPPEKFERQQFPMTGIPDMLDKFMLRLAAAAQIPVTILMGQSPAGMNATGQSDFQWFYDRIRAQQNLKLSPKIRRIVKLLLATKEFAGGSKLSDKVATKFPPLWTEPPLTRAQTRKTLLEGDAIAITNGMLVPAEASTARFTGGEGFETEIQLSDEGKKARDAELKGDLEDLTNPPEEEPPTPGAGGGFGGGTPAGAKGAFGGGAPKSPFARTDGDDQPREENGQFASTDGGGSSGGGAGKGGSASAGVDRGARAAARLETARGKLESARAALKEVDAEHESAVQSVQREVDNFRQQNEQDLARAAVLLPQISAEHAAAKAEARQLENQVEDLRERNPAVADRAAFRSVVAAHESRDWERQNREVLDELRARAQQETDPGARATQERNIARLAEPHFEEARAARERAEATAAPVVAKLSPEEHSLITRSVDTAERVEKLSGTKRELATALKNAPKHEELVSKIESAAKDGDVQTVTKLGNRLVNAATLRGAISKADPTDLDHLPSYSPKVGADFEAVSGYRESLKESATQVKYARARVERTERAVRVHEREVKRLAKRAS